MPSGAHSSRSPLEGVANVRRLAGHSPNKAYQAHLTTIIWPFDRPLSHPKRKSPWYTTSMMWLFVVSAIGGLAVADRWLKLLALSGTTRDFGFARFILFKNDALVFSWPAPNFVAIVLMIVAMAIVGGLAYRIRRRGNSLTLVGSFIILTGAVSNLYDRFSYGYVIDWAYLGRWWPVFNLADVMIGVGVLLIIIFSASSRTGGFKPAGTV